MLSHLKHKKILFSSLIFLKILKSLFPYEKHKEIKIKELL